MTTQTAEDVRKVAIDHHDDVVGVFQAWYAQMARDRFENVFAYGRHKVDVVLDTELKRLRPGATVLDVGCGTGEYLRRYKELGFEPMGLEPAPSMREAAQRGNPGIRVDEGVATALPYPDATFDFISAIEVLRYLHMADIRRCLEECRRVLKPGGILFVTLVNRWALDGFLLFQRARQLLLRSSFDRVHPHCEFFTPRQAESELARAGFVNGRTIGRLAGPVRVLYRVNANAGAAVARRVERIEDAAHELSITKAFAGHLIAIGERAR
jgi:ubiquinone/menaquinone biosynthesis C-methylase UbiE